MTDITIASARTEVASTKVQTPSGASQSFCEYWPTVRKLLEPLKDVPYVGPAARALLFIGDIVCGAD